ncbi:hypothetical protein CRG98_029934 [Punica granatum]|uniref:Uncharacterized protein n=1 Tax=Punica granatum TaxID=22663 RepID=A0A2I0J0B7_PUNGR|nr:hypothetical protein CRG98_029934 [Punica granatum]
MAQLRLTSPYSRGGSRDNTCSLYSEADLGIWMWDCADPNLHLAGARMLALSHGLEVSTFPWRRMTNTREKESPLPVCDPKVKGR